MQLMKYFPIHKKIKQFWRHQICKLYQNTTGRLVFMIVFGIQCNFFIVFPIQLKTCRSNGFLVFTNHNVHTWKIGRTSEVLHAWYWSVMQFVQAWNSKKAMRRNSMVYLRVTHCLFLLKPLSYEASFFETFSNPPSGKNFLVTLVSK